MVAPVRALNLSVTNVDEMATFYGRFVPGAGASDGVFAGIKYRALIGEDGEVAFCFFEAVDGSPLAPSFPTIMVDSVAEYLSRLTEQEGSVLVSPGPCPCTGAPFAICEDSAGNQFMVKEPRAASYL